MNKKEINELKKLVFWAHVGTLYSRGGSHASEIPKIIVKYMKKLNLNPSNFCSFDNPDYKTIAVDVLKQYTKVTEGHS